MKRCVLACVRVCVCCCLMPDLRVCVLLCLMPVDAGGGRDGASHLDLRSRALSYRSEWKMIRKRRQHRLTTDTQCPTNPERSVLIHTY